MEVRADLSGLRPTTSNSAPFSASRSALEGAAPALEMKVKKARADGANIQHFEAQQRPLCGASLWAGTAGAANAGGDHPSRDEKPRIRLDNRPGVCRFMRSAPACAAHTFEGGR